MHDPDFPEPGSLTRPEASALIAAARLVVIHEEQCVSIETHLKKAIKKLGQVLRHVMPEPIQPPPDDEDTPAALPWWTPEDVRAKIEQHANQ